VIGPNAHDPLVLLGNYYGTPSGTVTVLEGIRVWLRQVQTEALRPRL
jgi:beta-glucosidase